MDHPPERCWFCVGDGDWSATLLTPLGEPSVPVPDLIPAAVRRGPRVRLADDDYLLYAGPVEAAAALAPMPDMDQTPCLWWPDDPTARLLSDGKAVIGTSRGTVHARLKRPSRLRRGTLQIRTQGDNGVSGSSGHLLSYRGAAEVWDEISFRLTFHVIGLVGG